MCSYSCLKSGWEILFQVRINRSLTASGRVCPSHPRHRYWACWRPLHRQLSLLHSDEVQLGSKGHMGKSRQHFRPITSQSSLPDQSHLSARSCMKTKWRRNSKRSYYPPQSFPSPSNPTTSRRTSCEACTQLWRGGASGYLRAQLERWGKLCSSKFPWNQLALFSGPSTPPDFDRLCWKWSKLEV